LNIKTLFSVVNSSAAITIGLAARVLVPDLITDGDPELALPYLAQQLLPDAFVGLMLAGIFAATISPRYAKSYRWAKLGTLAVTAIVLSIALIGDKSVFFLVTFSWSALASALGPLVLVRIWQKPVTLPIALIMMGVGIATALVWSQWLNLSDVVYEVLPGILAGLAVYFIWSRGKVRFEEAGEPSELDPIGKNS
jgi:sodium/proline symporter